MQDKIKKYTLDFSKVNYYLEVHKIIKEGLDFPDYYGENWDALWDCLTDMLGEPFKIELIGMENLDCKFKNASDKITEIFRRLKHTCNDRYSDEIIIEIVSGDMRYEIN